MLESLKRFDHFNRQLALAVVLISISSFNYGFDMQAFGSVQAMAPFVKQFGVQNPTTKVYAIETYWTSLFNSLNYLGFGAGVLIGSNISARWGRRWCMFTMSLWAIISAIICVTSTNKDQLLAGRVLNYIYVGMELSVIPVYQSEIVPAPVRGMVVGGYQFSQLLGSLCIQAICRGTSTLLDNRSWQIPMSCFVIIPTIIAACIFFIPESPRWLLSKGRKEEALVALTRLRKGTLSADEIDRELDTTIYTLEREKEQGRFIELFQGTNLRRTLTILVVNFFYQGSGQPFTGQYGVLFFKSLGTVNPFDMALVLVACSAVCVMTTLLLLDRFGRRTFLFCGASVQTCAFLTVGILGCFSVTQATNIGLVTATVLTACGLVIGWGPMLFVITTELPSLYLRDQTQRVGSIVNVITGFTVSFCIPYISNVPYGGLGAKIGFIFAGIGILGLIFIFFFIPECKGKSLEEIDLMFHNHVPTRKFKNYDAKERLENAVTEDQILKEKTNGGKNAGVEVDLVERVDPGV